MIHLFQLNAGTLLVFELLYKLALAAIFQPVISGLMKAALRLQGLSYLSDETFYTFVKAPVTWVFLAVIVFLMAFFTLWDICCIIICFHASYRKQKMPLLTLMYRGLQQALRVVWQRNFILVLYLLIIIPMTHAIYMSGYTASFSVPEFIHDYIFSHLWMKILYVGFWIYMGLRTCHWIYSLHYFCLEGCNFRESRLRSRKLLAGHFWKDILAVVIWGGGLIGVYYGIVFAGSWLISRANHVLQNWDMFCSLTLSGISVLLDICAGLFYCFGLPVTFLGISLLFYYRKQETNEEIPPGFEDLARAYRLQDTRWYQKLHSYRKRIIALSLLVVLGVNFVYSYGEKKGFIHMGLSQNVEVTAHRGYSSKYPENTLQAFKGAIEIGADWIELDVQETADGEIIVMHDSNLKRTTGVDKNVWEVTYDEIKDLDNGSWFDKKYKEIRIPKLEDVLKLAFGKIRLNIEIKPNGHETDLEKKVADLIAAWHMENTCVVSSMKYESLQKVKTQNADIETAYITSVSYGNFTNLDAADGYSVESSMVTESFVRRAHNAGKKVYVWTVNSEETLSEVIDLGIDAVITDEPVMAKKLIYEAKHLTLWDRYTNRLLSIYK